jgi:hypothetical protein
VGLSAAVPRAASRHFCTEHTPREVELLLAVVLLLALDWPAWLAGDGLVGSFPSLVLSSAFVPFWNFRRRLHLSLSYPPHPPLYPSTYNTYHPSSPGTTAQVL